MKDKQKGMLSIMAAAFFFAAMNVFVKLSGDLPAPQKSFFPESDRYDLCFYDSDAKRRKAVVPEKGSANAADAFDFRNDRYSL